MEFWVLATHQLTYVVDMKPLMLKVYDDFILNNFEVNNAKNIVIISTLI